jgi:hypothetical protein
LRRNSDCEFQTFVFWQPLVREEVIEGAREHWRSSRAQGQLTTRSDAKEAYVVAMLVALEGTIIPAIVKAAGGQRHSVRGFVSAWSARSSACAHV